MCSRSFASWLILLGFVGAQDPAPAPKTFDLSFRVVWEGEIPPARSLAFPADLKERKSADSEFCLSCVERGKLFPEDLLVDGETRGVRNVAASLRGIRDAVPGLPDATLYNEDGRFHPRVQFVPVGRPVRVVNKDPISHNARLAGGPGQDVWNGLLAPESESPTRAIARGGSYRVFCDLHPWMSATLIAVRHPFVGVSDAQGRVTIRAIPARETAEIVLWHEVLGTLSKTVDQKAGAPAEIVVKSSEFLRPK
jgi:hypothetical protein